MLEGGGGKALMTWPLVEVFFCGFPKSKQDRAIDKDSSSTQHNRKMDICLLYLLYLIVPLYSHLIEFCFFTTLQGNSRKGFGWHRISCLLHYINYLFTPLHTNNIKPNPLREFPCICMLVKYFKSSFLVVVWEEATGGLPDSAEGGYPFKYLRSFYFPYSNTLKASILPLLLMLEHEHSQLTLVPAAPLILIKLVERGGDKTKGKANSIKLRMENLLVFKGTRAIYFDTPKKKPYNYLQKTPKLSLGIFLPESVCFQTRHEAQVTH